MGLEFLRGNAAGPSLSKAGVIRDADIGGSEGAILGFGRWRRLASNFLWTVIRADYPKVELVEHKMCLIEASVSAATHFLVCVMNGALFLIACFLEWRASSNAQRPFRSEYIFRAQSGFSEARAPSGIKARAFP